MSSPLDMIKDPYVFEFLGVPENKPMLESDLEKALVTPEAAGQLNMYLNYYAAEVNDEHDNPPIGIILCTDKDSIAAEYALGGLSNNIFASRYVSYIPNKEQFIAYHTVTFNVTIYEIDLLYLSRNCKKNSLERQLWQNL